MQDEYTIRQNTFGTYEVLIKFANGEERRRGRFTTKAAAAEWIAENRPSLTPALNTKVPATAGGTPVAV